MTGSAEESSDQLRRIVYTESMDTQKPSTPAQPATSSSPSSAPETKTRKEIPLISVPNDRDMIAAEMAELFDEDKVTHKHGSSEPEAD